MTMMRMMISTSFEIIVSLLLLTQLIVVVQSEVVPVNYTHNGDELIGYLAVPSSGSGPFPAVVIIP
jgi:hypothetical protein